MKRRALRLLLPLLALWIVWLGVSEPGPSYAPWTDPLPPHAVDAGYNSFRWRQGGRAIPGWPDYWLERHPPDPSGPLLIDRRHSSKQPETSALGLEEYGYDKMHGYARAFSLVHGAGIETREVWEPFTPLRLAGASAVFINLVSGDNPGLWRSEVLALEAFVRRGGGLFLVTDHTNCYFHAELLQPLTEALGLELRPVTAADKGQGRTLSPRTVAWLRVLARSEHPVMRGVSAFGLMTGGSMRGRPGSAYEVLATTSEAGWADLWEPMRKDDSSGFTGDLKRSEQEPNEAVPVVVAGAYGQGRVLVFGDQNALGSTLVGFEDTERLFANGMAWVTGRPVPTEGRGPNTVTTLAGDRVLCTAAAHFGYRTLQVQAARLAALTGVPEFCTLEAETRSQRLLLLPEVNHPDLERLMQQATRGVLLVDHEADGSQRALRALGLELTLDPGEPASGIRWKQLLPAPPHPVFKGALELEPLPANPVTVSGDFEVLAEDERGRPLLLRVQALGGQWLVLLDADLLRNEHMGGERDLPKGTPTRAAAHRLAFRLLGWLWE